MNYGACSARTSTSHQPGLECTSLKNSSVYYVKLGYMVNEYNKGKDQPIFSGLGLILRPRVIQYICWYFFNIWIYNRGNMFYNLPITLCISTCGNKAYQSPKLIWKAVHWSNTVGRVMDKLWKFIHQNRRQSLFWYTCSFTFQNPVAHISHNAT